MVWNQLVGRQIVDFKNDKQERIQGVKLHFLCQDDKVVGKMAATQFISITSPLYDLAMKAPFGDFRFEYGMRGKIVDIILPEAPADPEAGKGK